MHYLSGIPVVGFVGLFEARYGDPDTPRPYCRVTPSRVGSAILPFRCPRCRAAIDFTDPAVRDAHRDARDPGRVNHFCPRCGLRFYLHEGGAAPPSCVDDGGAAPAIVERVVRCPDGGTDIRRVVLGGRRERRVERYVFGCDLMGASSR